MRTLQAMRIEVENARCRGAVPDEFVITEEEFLAIVGEVHLAGVKVRVKRDDRKDGE